MIDKIPLQDMVDKCEGKHSKHIPFNDKERICDLLTLTLDKNAKCPHSQGNVVRDIGSGMIEKLRNVYLCNFKTDGNHQ